MDKSSIPTNFPIPQSTFLDSFSFLDSFKDAFKEQKIEGYIRLLLDVKNVCLLT